MKVFISQKMKGLTPSEISLKRKQIMNTFSDFMYVPCDFLPSYRPELAYCNPITALSQSLALMAEADVVLVPLESAQADMNVNPRGCEFEYAIAKAYGKAIYIYNDSLVYTIAKTWRES